MDEASDRILTPIISELLSQVPRNRRQKPLLRQERVQATGPTPITRTPEGYWRSFKVRADRISRVSSTFLLGVVGDHGPC